MGLMDVLNGMQNGPHGTPQSGKGGMSPITMAILGLLAYKAVKSISGGQSAPAGNQPTPQMPSGGGLGNVLAGGLGGLGGLLAGGAAGSVLSNGLGDLLKQFQQNGLGDAANSWVGTGQNQPVSPNDLAKALGADQIDALTNQTGMSRDDLLQSLSQYLPQAIDSMTPNGRVPTEHEAGHLL